mgnify:CR=1 FL=1
MKLEGTATIWLAEFDMIDGTVANERLSLVLLLHCIVLVNNRNIFQAASCFASKIRFL